MASQILGLISQTTWSFFFQMKILIFVVNLSPKNIFNFDGSVHNGGSNQNYFEQKMNFAGQYFENPMKSHHFFLNLGNPRWRYFNFCKKIHVAMLAPLIILSQTRHFYSIFVVLGHDFYMTTNTKNLFFCFLVELSTRFHFYIKSNLTIFILIKYITLKLAFLKKSHFWGRSVWISNSHNDRMKQNLAKIF